MSGKDCRRLTAASFFNNFDDTVVYKAITRSVLADARSSGFKSTGLIAAAWKEFFRVPSAVVVQLPEPELEEQPVLRNWLWFPRHVEGPHNFWTGKDYSLVTEPLWTTLGAVDDKLDPEQQWKEAPLYEDCLQPVEPRK